jgi:hypothetical protein
LNRMATSGLDRWSPPRLIPGAQNSAYRSTWPYHIKTLVVTTKVIDRLYRPVRSRLPKVTESKIAEYLIYMPDFIQIRNQINKGNDGQTTRFYIICAPQD